jgi:hypothetical protein
LPISAAKATISPRVPEPKMIRDDVTNSNLNNLF